MNKNLEPAVGGRCWPEKTLSVHKGCHRYQTGKSLFGVEQLNRGLHLLIILKLSIFCKAKTFVQLASNR